MLQKSHTPLRRPQALFVGGGNGFRLLKELYKYPGLVQARPAAVLNPHTRLNSPAPADHS